MTDETEVMDEKKYLLLVRVQSFGQDSGSVLLCQVGNDQRTAIETAKSHLAPYGTMDAIELGVADDLLESGVLLRNGVTPHQYNSNHLYEFNNELKAWNDPDLVDEYRLKKYGPSWMDTPDPSDRSARAIFPDITALFLEQVSNSKDGSVPFYPLPTWPGAENVSVVPEAGSIVDQMDFGNGYTATVYYSPLEKKE